MVTPDASRDVNRERGGIPGVSGVPSMCLAKPAYSSTLVFSGPEDRFAAKCEKSPGKEPDH
jgi:hypothetical protein